MNSSELKPKLLAILFKLFEVSPRPNTGGTVKSLLPAIKGAKPDEINGMMEHLAHTNLIELRNQRGDLCASITDKGIKWLSEHNESLKQNSWKTWLLKPIIVGSISTFIGLILGIIVGAYSPYIQNMLAMPQADTQSHKPIQIEKNIQLNPNEP